MLCSHNVNKGVFQRVHIQTVIHSISILKENKILSIGTQILYFLTGNLIGRHRHLKAAHSDTLRWTVIQELKIF